MVKTPRTRHSKKTREPVTIDLEAEAVGREKGEEDEKDRKEAAAGSSAAAAAGDDAKAAEASETADAGQDAEKPENDAPGAAPAATAEGDEGADGQDGDRQEAEAASEPAGTRPPAGGGFGRALAAGLAGGVVALAIGWGLQWSGVLPAPGGAESAPVAEDLRQEIAAVRDELAQMSEAGQDEVSGEAAEQALAESRQQVTDLQSQIGALREEVAALQSAAPGEGGAAALEPLEQRLSEVEGRVSSLAETAGEAGAGEELRQQLGAAEERIAEAAQTADAAQQTAAANAQRLEEIGTRLTQLQEQVESQDEGPRLALIVAASALRSAVERGEPFASELETYTALAPDAAAVEPLGQYAETGIPTQAALAAEAPEVASRIAASTSDLPPDAGLLDRLMASARSAVNVRPVGEVEGDTPEAGAARLEAAVQRGDYARALAEYEALPLEAREAAGDFADKLRARQAANEVLEKALSSALNPA